MSLEYEIDYDALIDRAIEDFQPVKRLWPVGTRLLCWVVLEITILVLTPGFRGYDHLSALIRNAGPIYTTGLATVVSIPAAFLALRSAIPGREVTPQELALLIAMVCAALLIGFGAPAAPVLSSEFLQAGVVYVARFIGVVALPWVALFWAVRRGVPLQPVKTGALVGLSAFCFALAVHRFNQPPGFQNPDISLTILGPIIVLLSALAGGLWLNWIKRWRQARGLTEAWQSSWARVSAQTRFPIAISASIVALILVLKGPSGISPSIPDFDLVIENYELSLNGFRPNVPSSSIATMLTAYVERWMPAYMWDFGREGFKFAGGRWQPLTDGTPATYTWFRGGKSGVICMMRQTDGFNPPPGGREIHQGVLFYRYHGV
jgi:hypothetical protein